MIDPSAEELLSLSAAAKRIPVRRGGKKTHVSTIYRWTSSGCRDEVLESIQIGGTRCTSVEALSRFFRRLTNRQTFSKSAESNTPIHVDANVEQELDSMGL